MAVALEGIPEEAGAQFYIPATDPTPEPRPRILKQGDTFAVFNHFGDIVPRPGGQEGIYHHDTRFLSRSELVIDDRRPLLLSSTVGAADAMLTADLTNPDFYVDGRLVLARDSLHLHRIRFIWQGACYERLVLRNFDERRRRISLGMAFEGDFVDLFELRGQKRARRGRGSAQVLSASAIALRYRGLDDVMRETVICFSPAPDWIGPTAALFKPVLEPHRHVSIFQRIACCDGAQPEPRRWSFFVSRRQARRDQRAKRTGAARIASSNSLFDEVLGRSFSDLYMLVTRTEQGLYPYAGIPWFSTVFGRDGIITSLLTLWLDPTIALGVLKFLAAMQATEIDPSRDAEPGKIVHELRKGEMARLREIPFDRYYGSVDATPLFVMLAGRYLQRTGDIETIRDLWPHLQAALDWIDTYGDIDGDGFVEYGRKTDAGLVNQGWKDSVDSVFHADGSLARGPIALCEVQGYVYAAKRLAAEMARRLGMASKATILDSQAEALREAFEEVFWCEALSTYALALDGSKAPCRVVASNAGHALFAGIAGPERAARTAATLMRPASFSGWGIRTVAAGQPRYNPISYHNGSIWPHDNAIVALGLARYGQIGHAVRVLRAIFEAAVYMDLRRLPELFCGFPRRQSLEPTSYPVACAPQAWASATLFALLQASLGLSFDQRAGQIRFIRPVLPDFISELRLDGLSLGGAAIDVLLRRHESDVSVNVLTRTGPVSVVTVS